MVSLESAWELVISLMRLQNCQCAPPEAYTDQGFFMHFAHLGLVHKAILSHNIEILLEYWLWRLHAVKHIAQSSGGSKCFVRHRHHTFSLFTNPTCLCFSLLNFKRVIAGKRVHTYSCSTPRMEIKLTFSVRNSAALEAENVALVLCNSSAIRELRACLLEEYPMLVS